MSKNKLPYHVIVVGAGIIGASIAFHLALREARVTIVDAGQPGGGASGVSFAWINARDKNPRFYHDLNRRSLDIWDRFARRLGGDVGLTWGGELRWAATHQGAEELARRVRTLQSWGYPIQALDAAQLQQLEPGLAAGAVSAASFTSVDGHVDTGRVIDACLAQAEERGATLHAHTQVTSLRLAQSQTGTTRVEAIGLDDDEMPCHAVVLAGGPDTPQLAAMAGVFLPLHYTFGATMITHPSAPLFRQVAVVHSPDDLDLPVAVRQFADGSVMIHGGEGSTGARSLGQTDEEIQQVYNAATHFFPALKDVPIRQIRSGRRPIPKDGHPVLGFTRAVANLYLAAMHSGVTLAPLVGELAAIEIVDGARIDFLEPYRVERF